MHKLYWDYYGPEATRVAEHFERHLKTWLTQNALTAISTGVEVEGAGTAACFCVCTPDVSAALMKALRPHRGDDLGVVKIG